MLAAASFAQSSSEKDEQFNKIVKLSQTKKPADQEKAYQSGKDFVNKFGKDEDEKTKKIKEFVANYRINLFNQKLNDGKTADAYALGKEILAQEPENTYATMNLAYAGYDASNKIKDNSFSADSIRYAAQTLQSIEAGKLPNSFEPFANQAEATAMMHYVIAHFNMDSNLKLSAEKFYKALQYESRIKNTSYPYYIIAFYYDKEYEKAARDYQTKHGSKTTEDSAMKADNEKLEKLLQRMLDAYARTIKFAEPGNPTRNNWKQRFTQIYTFVNQNENGLEDYINNITSKPMPDPNTL